MNFLGIDPSTKALTPIHSKWVDMDRLESDALYATQIAHRIWQQAGWRPWTCSRYEGIR